MLIKIHDKWDISHDMRIGIEVKLRTQASQKFENKTKTLHHHQRKLGMKMASPIKSLRLKLMK